MHEFWTACLNELKTLIKHTPGIYNTWFAPLEPVSWDPEHAKLVLEAPLPKLSSVRSKYLGTIQTVATLVN